MEHWTVQAIRRLKDHHLKQKDVAAVMGVTPEHVSRILNGKKKTRRGEWQIMSAIDKLTAGTRQEVAG